MAPKAIVDPEPAAIDPNDIDALLATQPDGSHVEYVGGLYNFYRGPGRTSHGQGKTVLRAIQTVNASYQKSPYNETSVLVDEHGEVLPPE